MRQIDADALKKDVLDLPNCYNGFSDTYDKACIIGVIDEQPTIEERKTGKWNWIGFNIECSECGCMPCFDSTEPLYNYCPNCGADMREENR